MAQEGNVVRRGIYNVEYFSGAQVSLYIGDVWVDEITTLSYGYQQSRQPIYGYASTLFDDVSEGRVLVSGQFTINFKEAGYLWLILDRYRRLNKNRTSLVADSLDAFANSGSANRENIEQLTNRESVDAVIEGTASVFERNQFFQDLARIQTERRQNPNAPGADIDAVQAFTAANRTATASSLGGFASNTRAIAAGADPGEQRPLGRSENIFEAFEDRVWGKTPQELDRVDRRADDDRLNPFEIYVAFGDFAGDNTDNHTIERLRNVYILGKSKQVQIDGMPVQEQYTFIARNLV